MGVMFLPNGNGGLMVLPTPSTPAPPPSEYSGSYLTDNDVRVDVTYRTANKALADDYEAVLMQATGWKVAPAPVVVPEAPASLLSDLGAGAALIIALAIAIPAVAFFGSILLEIADLIEFRTIDLVLKYSIRAMLVAAPIALVLLSSWTLKQHSSQDKHG